VAGYRNKVLSKCFGFPIIYRSTNVPYSFTSLSSTLHNVRHWDTQRRKINHKRSEGRTNRPSLQNHWTHYFIQKALWCLPVWEERKKYCKCSVTDSPFAWCLQNWDTKTKFCMRGIQVQKNSTKITERKGESKTQRQKRKNHNRKKQKRCRHRYQGFVDPKLTLSQTPWISVLALRARNYDTRVCNVHLLTYNPTSDRKPKLMSPPATAVTKRVFIQRNWQWSLIWQRSFIVSTWEKLAAFSDRVHVRISRP